MVSTSSTSLLHEDHPPASRTVLMEWLSSAGVTVHPAVEIEDMEDGTGWCVAATQKIGEHELRESSLHTGLISVLGPKVCLAIYPHILPAPARRPGILGRRQDQHFDPLSRAMHPARAPAGGRLAVVRLPAKFAAPICNAGALAHVLASDQRRAGGV
jgi:hypothetical protein